MNLQLKRPGGLRAFLAKEFILSQNGSDCCTLRFENWRGTAFYLQDVQFHIHTTGRGTWRLTRGGLELARCQRHLSGAKVEFDVRFKGREWRFVATREGLFRCHQILEGALEVGRIRSTIGWLHIGLDADFEHPPALEIVSFAMWLIGIHWGGMAGKVTPVRAQLGI